MLGQKKATREGWLFGVPDWAPGSDGDDVLRLRTFLAFGYGHRNFLAFIQRLAAAAVDGAVMYKYILAPFASDESESLLIIEPLHGTFDLLCHIYLSLCRRSGLQHTLTLRKAYTCGSYPDEPDEKRAYMLPQYAIIVFC